MEIGKTQLIISQNQPYKSNIRSSSTVILIISDDIMGYIDL